MGAFDSSGVEALGELQAYRHKLAHKSAALILEPDFKVDDDVVRRGREVLASVTRFWIQIELDINPADGESITAEDVIVPVVEFFDHVHEIERAWQSRIAANDTEH